MKLLSLAVENYRIHRSLRIAFDAQRTVIGGENETGKSTLMEAVHHALFLRGRVSGSVAELLQSLLYTGYPSVELTFETSGVRYTISKEYRGGVAAASVLREHNGETLRGEEAETKIHELLNASELGGGRGLKNRIRSQWGHLFCWQGQRGGDPVKSLTDGEAGVHLRNRLGALDGGTVLESALDLQISRLLDERFNETFTDKGTTRVASELGRAKQKVAEALEACEKARARVAAVEEAADTVESSLATISSCDKEIAFADAELTEVQKRQDDVTRLKFDLAEKVFSKKLAEAELKRLKDADNEIHDIATQITTACVLIQPAQDAVDDLRRQAAEANQQFQLVMAECSRCKKNLARNRAMIQMLELCQQHARLLVEKAGLGGRCQQIKTLRSEARTLLEKLESHVVITAEDLEELVDLQQCQERKKATLDAIATRVEVLQSECMLTLGKEELHEGAARTVTEPTELTINAAGSLVVLQICPGGGRSVDEARSDYEDARQMFADRLQELQVADLSEARRLQTVRQDLQSERRAKDTAIEGLGGDQALNELEVLDAEISAINGEITRRMPTDFQRPPPDEVTERIETARQEALQDDERWTEASEELEAAKLHLDAMVTARDQGEEELRRTLDEKRALEVRREVLLESHGENREEAIAKHSKQVANATKEVEETEADLNQKDPEGISRERLRCERALEKLARQKQEAETRLAIARKELSHDTGTDPRVSLQQTVTQHGSAKDQFLALERRAMAVKLLKKLFGQKRSEVEKQFIAPLTDRLTDYLKILYGPDVSIQVGYVDGQFEKLTIVRGENNVLFQFSQLSGGTKEQVSAAFRLAMAELLAERHGGCLPLIFDDSFTDSDANRMRNLQRMLDLAASRGLQIIVLSCRPEQYAGLGATLISLPQQSEKPNEPA